MYFADIDECELEMHDCDNQYSSCVNLPGSYYCNCFNELHWNGSHCIELLLHSSSSTGCRVFQVPHYIYTLFMCVVLFVVVEVLSSI